MSSLTLNNQIKKLVDTYIKTYMKEVSVECKVDISQLQCIWKRLNTKEKKIILTNESRPRCPYIFVRGHKSGQTCNAIVKKGEYCTKHNKYKHIMVDENPKRIVIRKNKHIDKYWHSPTRLIFKSKEEKIVIGVLDEDDVIQKLSEKDVSNCEKLGFAYDKKDDKK